VLAVAAVVLVVDFVVDVGAALVATGDDDAGAALVVTDTDVTLFCATEVAVLFATEVVVLLALSLLSAHATDATTSNKTTRRLGTCAIQIRTCVSCIKPLILSSHTSCLLRYGADNKSAAAQTTKSTYFCTCSAHRTDSRQVGSEGPSSR
jgi:hypothetical protein